MHCLRIWGVAITYLEGRGSGKTRGLVKFYLYEKEADIFCQGSGWPTSLRRWYTMLALQLSGFKLRQQQRKRMLGRPMQRRCPNSQAGSEWKTSDVNLNL